MKRIVIVALIVFPLSLFWHSSYVRHKVTNRGYKAIESAVVESFEYGYACRAANAPHDECLANIKKMLKF